MLFGKTGGEADVDARVRVGGFDYDRRWRGGSSGSLLRRDGA